MKEHFEQLCDDLQYFYVEDHKEMTIEEISEKCREFIREKGFNCLDDNYDEDREVKEWIEMNNPEWSTDGLEWHSILYNDLEFLCIDKYNDDFCFGNIQISFYGDYDKGLGVFNVYV